MVTEKRNCEKGNRSLWLRTNNWSARDLWNQGQNAAPRTVVPVCLNLKKMAAICGKTKNNKNNFLQLVS